MATRKSSESGSRRSRRSSKISQLAITAAEARADAAMQLARAKYAKERAAAEIEAAKAKATYECLLQEEAAAVAEAKSNVLQQQLHDLETFSDDSLEQSVSSSEESDYYGLPATEPAHLVADYVSRLPDELVEATKIPPPQNNQISPKQEEVCSDHEPPPKKDTKSTVTHQPTDTTTKNPTHDILQGMMKLYARRDLVTHCIPTFDDEPENFRAWKLSFKNAIDGVPVSSSEETDLILRYTGPKSAEIAKSARAVHISDPVKGLAVVWERLEEKYGTPEIVTTALINKLSKFPEILYGKNEQLRKFADLVQMVDQAKKDGSLPGLCYLDTFIGINPLVTKLPRDLQEKWRSRAFRYKQENEDKFPPFDIFSKFITDFAKQRNDKSLMLCNDEAEPTTHVNPKRFSGSSKPVHRTKVLTKLTGVTKAHDNPAIDNTDACPIHKTNHLLINCRSFLKMPLEEKRSLLREYQICYRCVASKEHIARNCKAKISCSICGSNKHIDVLHIDTKEAEAHGGEQTSVLSKCTQVCHDKLPQRSCSKICLARAYIDGYPENAIMTYVVLDDQSNKSLAKSKLFELLKVKGEPMSYTLRTCSGVVDTTGRRMKDLIVESVTSKVSISVPPLIECNAIPDCREEIPTPDAAKHHSHLKSIANEIPEIDPNAEILILLGRDAPQAHKVREVRNGQSNSPWGHRMDLGWVVVGEVCIGKAHHSNTVNTFRTHVLPNGRPSSFESCTNYFNISHLDHPPDLNTNLSDHSPNFGHDVFHSSRLDNKVGTSTEDRQFLKIMNSEFSKGETGNWIAPLPFRLSRPPLPNNRHGAMKRFNSLLKSFARNPKMKGHYLQFMTNMLENGHAEQVECNTLCDGERWYLPHFPVYHPKKPDKIRVVFDSSAEYQGVSLNRVLMTGPDLTNNLLGVLLRFREDVVAFMADIEQMFYSFHVKEEHRDYLRFLWFRNNNPEEAPVDYRMKVHTFGNSPSPAVATFGLRKTAEEAEDKFGKDAQAFVNRNFYVDDGLKSLPTPNEAVDLLQRTKSMLATANLRLHKIASNNAGVMEAFPIEDHAGDIDLDLNAQTPITRSLGVYWDLNRDVFTFRIGKDEKPYTKRGVLAEINSIYDPFGIAAPVLIQGKLLLREMTSEKSLDWDHPLPDHTQAAWCKWRTSLPILAETYIPRAYTPAVPSTQAQRRELHTFVDASTHAIGAVSYLKVIDTTGKIHVSFVLGKGKLAPKQATTIPRLELCAAVLGAEIAEFVSDELDLNLDEKFFYSDSRVVLGYISNQTRQNWIYGQGIIRVGGRLKNADVEENTAHPIVLPGSHHVCDLIIRYYHEQVHHQGRHLTRGAIRNAGYWIVGEKRKVISVIDQCINCRKWRGKEQSQMMADLPVERLSPAPPFTYVGLDVFGPWDVSTRKTRGGQAKGKRWAVIFVCMTCRAIHIEVIESMEASSFINALRRFLAIRGPVKQIRSDCGTNFVGACNEIGLPKDTNLKIKKYLLKHDCEWIFNPPHSSHMGGAWERLIGVSRRILDNMFAEMGPIKLTHEVLTTLMAEVTAIVNCRPLTPVSSDPEYPDILTPNMILTQKTQSMRAPNGNYSKNDLFGKQWRRVQFLADMFWKRWKREYIPLLQVRRKWHRVNRCLKEGDLVLMKEKEIHRNNWPMGRVTKTMESSDKLVRKVELKVSRDGSSKILSRPVHELILLIPVEQMS